MVSVPTVSIVVLNYNGLRHLDACFSSLARLDYPADRLERMLVDNASRDGSVAHVRATFPGVRIVENPTNLGFSSGNNRGAAEATGEYVVFLNNDMRVDPQLVHGFLRAMNASGRVVCAGAKILNWDGTLYDFAGSAAHFGGYGYQAGLEQPVRPGQFAQVTPILFACGGAMMIRRQLFLDVGGFDDDYFMCYEDVDLGWRLWLLGHEVVFAPAAIVYHRHHGTMGALPGFRRQVLYKRNALYTVTKNYDAENLGRVLPAVLLATVEGVVANAVRGGDLDLADYSITSRTRSAPRANLDKHGASTLVAIHDVVRHLPRVMEKRRFVQENRRRSDGEVAKLFRRPFRHWPDVEAETQYAVADAFDVQRLFEGLPRRVLVISSDILPYPGMPTVGSGLRAWGLGQGLRCRGHEVLYSMPRAALVGREPLAPPEASELAWEPFSLGDLVRKADPDIVVACNWPVLALLPSEWLGIPVILDQHGPHLMEREYQKAGDVRENTERKLSALRKADFFTCAGNKQRTYFQSWLERAGWTEQEWRERSAVIPVSLSPELPDRRPDDDVTFVYGGVFLPWQDPSNALSVLVETLDERGHGTLYFYGGKHPVYPVDTGIFTALLEKLQQSSRVVARAMVPHQELIERYTRAHVSIDVMRRNPERELAFTTRTVEYLWCGLPVIYHDYAELSEYIREYDAGWIVDPEDRDAIAAVLKEIFDHPEEIERRSRNARRLVRDRLTWDRTIEPMDRFIRRPRMRHHEKPPFPVTMQNARSLLKAAWTVYRQQGGRALWRKSSAFLRRNARR